MENLRSLLKNEERLILQVMNFEQKMNNMNGQPAG